VRYEEQIEAVTAQAVLESARRVLDPRGATLAIMGSKAADVPFEVP
jgi:predicted Zn-dependent peptidase